MSDRIRSTPPVRTATPAFQCCSIEHCTGVLRTSCDRETRSSSSEIHSWKIVTHFSGLISLIVRIAVTKSSIRTIPPTLDGRIVEEPTGMCCTCANGHGCSSSAEIYRRGGRNCWSNPISDVDSVVRTQTTVACRAPTLHRTVVKNCAHVQIACRQSSCCPTHSKSDW